MKKHFVFYRQENPFGFYLDCGARTFIEIFSGEAEPREGAIRHLCLEVDNIDRTIARLRECGYEVTDKKLGSDRSWQCWSADPDGTRIEFHEYTPQSSQYTRAGVEVNW